MEIEVTLELGSLILAAVGALATWLHNRQHQSNHRQRERHHQEAMKAMHRQADATASCNMPAARTRVNGTVSSAVSTRGTDPRQAV